MPSETNNDITELMIAASRGEAARVESLIREGANVNARDRFGFTALLYAASAGHLKVAEDLIDAGADVGARTRNNMSGYDLAKSKGHERVAALLRHTRLFLAARDGDLAVINELLDDGVDPNVRLRDEWTALMIAALHDRPQVVAALLRRGAYADARNADGLSPISIAELKGFREVEQILKYGAPDPPPSPLLAPDLKALKGILDARSGEHGRDAE